MKIELKITVVVDEKQWVDDDDKPGDLSAARKRVLRDAEKLWANTARENSEHCGVVVKEGPNTHLIMGAGYWGAGDTLVEAKANFKAAGGRLSRPYITYRFGEKSIFDGVDGYGRVSWYGEDPEQLDRKGN